MDHPAAAGVAFDGDFAPSDSLWWQHQAMQHRQPSWAQPDRAFSSPQQTTYHSNGHWGQYSYPGQEEFPPVAHPGYQTAPLPSPGVAGNPGYPAGTSMRGSVAWHGSQWGQTGNSYGTLAPPEGHGGVRRGRFPGAASEVRVLSQGSPGGIWHGWSDMDRTWEEQWNAAGMRRRREYSNWGRQAEGQHWYDETEGFDFEDGRSRRRERFGFERRGGSKDEFNFDEKTRPRRDSDEFGFEKVGSGLGLE